jgi:hypothetical protein
MRLGRVQRGVPSALVGSMVQAVKSTATPSTSEASTPLCFSTAGIVF